MEKDPLFSDDRFHLSGESPCINTGYNLLEDTMKMDFDGNDRVLGPLIDLGPQESAVGGTDAYNAALQSITVDNGTLEPEFKPDVFVYYDTLPDNTTGIPAVTATPYYSGTLMTIDDASDLTATDESDRTTVITTTSQNGLITYQYKIVFYSENTSGFGNVTTTASWTVYPNPATEKLTIGGEGIENPVLISLTDLSGKKVMEISENAVINVSNVIPGTYFLRLISGENSRIFKIVIKK